MAAFQTLLYIAIAIGASCWAAIPYDKLELNIFDDRPRDFELHVFEATQKVERFFARDEILYGIAAGLLALNSTTLYVGPFAELTSLVRDTLGGRGEWRMRLTTAISTEVLHGITENEIRWMEATIRTIQDKTKLLDDSNPDLDNRKTIASIIHTDLSKMINFFDIKTSLFRRYPLIGTPPLIQLASLVALFSPIAQTLIPMEAKNPQIACKMYDVLMDYRPRTVAARLHKLSAETSNAEKTIFNSIVKAMALPYNQRGYNETSPATIDCEQGCKNRVSHCLTDTFGTVEYYVSNEYTSTCVTDLLKFIRYRVEKLFPIDLLDKLCVNRAPKIPTGNFIKNSEFAIFFFKNIEWSHQNHVNLKLKQTLFCHVNFNPFNTKSLQYNCFDILCHQQLHCLNSKLT